MRDPGLSFVTLGVSDVSRATRFYAEGLGLRQLKSLPGISFFDLGSVRLALYQRESLESETGVSLPPTGSSAVALGYNVGSQREVERLLSRAKQAGGQVLRPPGPTDWGGYAGYFADPDGFLWEVAWNPNLSPVRDTQRPATPGGVS
jgi:catechol 2,3-dioxygenase-like lactoylglutathione lyase family enzyme